jgi:hypothetical protein
MQIVYEGAPHGVYLLAQALEEEGVEVRYSPLDETRGAGQIAVTVVLSIVGGTAADLTSDALKAAAERAIVKVREQWPQVEAEIEDY